MPLPSLSNLPIYASTERASLIWSMYSNNTQAIGTPANFSVRSDYASVTGVDSNNHGVTTLDAAFGMTGAGTTKLEYYFFRDGVEGVSIPATWDLEFSYNVRTSTFTGGLGNETELVQLQRVDAEWNDGSKPQCGLQIVLKNDTSPGITELYATKLFRVPSNITDILDRAAGGWTAASWEMDAIKCGYSTETNDARFAVFITRLNGETGIRAKAQIDNATIHPITGVQGTVSSIVDGTLPTPSSHTYEGFITPGDYKLEYYIKRSADRADLTTGRYKVVMTRIDTGEEATVLNYVGGQYWGYYAWPFTRFFNHLDYCLGWPASGNISMQFSNLEFWDTAPSSFKVTVADYLSHSDISYGSDAEHKMDVYSSGRPDAPVIVMVHGGFWFLGDKANAAVVDNKVLYWCGRGYTVVSINYRLDGIPLHQVLDIESAIDYIKANAATYDIDTTKIILMGHSSGGHIATLFAITRPTEIAGAVILDSAVMDMDDTMNNTHVAAFDTVFTASQAYWNANSPKYQFTDYNNPDIPLTHTMIVSSTISAQMTAQNTAFATQASCTLLASGLDHDSTNSDLGLYGEYTQSVSDFIDALVA